MLRLPILFYMFRKPIAKRGSTCLKSKHKRWGHKFEVSLGLQLETKCEVLRVSGLRERSLSSVLLGRLHGGTWCKEEEGIRSHKWLRQGKPRSQEVP